MFIEDCSVCSKFVDLLQTMDTVLEFIDIFGKNGRCFGLYKSAVETLRSDTFRLKGYHEDYHGRGDCESKTTESLIPEKPVVNSWKKPKWKPRNK